ncbi:hypothetical protein BT69DRAFT_34244 [Atractiella rhizophila]|nr:hypothetical protein BT69DRAFT_34244 [Atractiella rhizophila]
MDGAVYSMERESSQDPSPLTPPSSLIVGGDNVEIQADGYHPIPFCNSLAQPLTPSSSYPCTSNECAAARRAINEALKQRVQTLEQQLADINRENQYLLEEADVPSLREAIEACVRKRQKNRFNKWWRMLK